MDNSPFSSVNQFLEAAKAAKEPARQQVERIMADAVNDPGAFSVPPNMLPTINGLLETYGDESLKNIGMFCIARWLEVHQERLDEWCSMDDMQGALWTMNDISKLATALQIISDIGSFGGDDQWKEMIAKEVSKTMYETLEEQGKLDDFIRHNSGEAA